MARTPQQLVEAALGSGPSDAAAVDELIAAGAAAAPALISAIRSGRATGTAGALLGLLDVPDRVALLAPLATGADDSVRDLAIAALARTGDPRAVAVIAAAYPRRPLLTLSALGNLGRPEAREPLRTILAGIGDPTAPGVLSGLCARAVEDLDPSDLLAVAVGAASLAKLGDFSLVGAARELARFTPDEAAGFDQAGLVRLDAVRALDVAVGPGVLATLLEAIADPDPEVAEAAVLATMHGGRVHVVDRWLDTLERSGGALSPAVFNGLVELTGERPPDDTAALEGWWAQRKPRFDPAVCYRRGAPATPAVLLPRARGPDSAIARIELQQMIGVGFLAPELSTAPRAETAALDAWWAAHDHEFPAGQLHRWGRSYAPHAID